MVIRKNGQEFRPVGIFVIEEKNRLAYILREPEGWRKKYNLPKKITFQGFWHLNGNHDLIFKLIKTKKQFGGDQLYLNSELVNVQSDAIIFSLATKEKLGIHKIRLLQLKGRWQADKYNRLCFLVKRIQAWYDTLTFQCAWYVKDNVLIYQYKKIYLKRRQRIKISLTFQGFWAISQKNRLAYVLDIKNNSYFSFKAHFETPSLIEKTGSIKYRVGVGLKGTSLFRVQIITLYGVWKLSRKLGLSFEIDYGRGKVKAILFKGTLHLTKRKKLILQLKNREGKPLGMNLTLSQKFLKSNAQWFLKLAKEARESRIEGGFKLPL